MPAIPNIFSDGKPEEEIVPRASFRRALHEMALYVGIVLRVFFMTRRGFLGLVLAAIPFSGRARRSLRSRMADGASPTSRFSQWMRRLARCSC
jgi:hypothetical protein